ncbi:MAG TPA: hypothetical protein ENJ80_00935 [Gammaproteobacteria bacterium]|nr:hypothetical protein [Gammaproteobacteria bacterium]
MAFSGTTRICAILCLLLTTTVAVSQEKTAVPTIDAKDVLAQPDNIPQWLNEGRLQPEQIPSPHWRDDACRSCHTSSRPSRRKLALRHKNPDLLCKNCHDPATQHAYIHPADITPDPAMRKRMPADYRQAMKKGKIVCTTCHDLPAQCLVKRRQEQRNNPAFLRGAPFAHRSEPCYLCHDAKAYARINPHDQITDGGQIREATCVLCHDDVKQLQADAAIENVGFNIKQDLAKMCTGCHPWIPHPGGKFMFSSTFKDRKHPEHLTVPPEPMRKYMQHMAVKNDIILPLDPTTGKVYCATCHNPHERGLLKNSAAAKGADADKRLRMKDICTNCHDK